MKIEEILAKDFKEALKQKNIIRKNTIQILRAEILNNEKAKQRKLEESEIVGIILKEIKQKNKAVVEFEKGEREDLVLQTKNELSVLKEYVPEAPSEDKIHEVIKKWINFFKPLESYNMGAIIYHVKEECLGADGKIISELVKEELKRGRE